MQYLVVGADGKEYGPVDMDALRQWVRESRITPTTQLKDWQSGQIVVASSIAGLFSTPQAPPAPSMPGTWSNPAAYAQPTQFRTGSDGSGVLWNSIARSALALVFFFVLHGLGLVFGIYAVIYGFQAHSSGHKYGTVALVVSPVSMVAILIGWGLRLQSMRG